MVKKILLVDDETDTVGIISSKLEADGFKVFLSRNGRDGLIQARAHLPDMVLMDIVLPDMDGAEVVKELHDHPATVGVPVIFLSGIVVSDGNGDAEITVGGRDYMAIGKPFTYRELKEKIDAVLKLTE
ncbi:MAG: response regulator [Candidatus Omnitrophota bacterium]